jgi:hypothetical protein
MSVVTCYLFLRGNIVQKIKHTLPLDGISNNMIHTTRKAQFGVFNTFVTLVQL